MGVALALVLGLSGCGWGDEYPGPTPPAQVTGIGPAGGWVVADDGMAMITVPAGALDQVVDLTVTPAADCPEGAVTGTAYDFGPVGTVFAVPCTLAIGYDPALLPAGTTLAQLYLAEATADAWRPLDDFTAHTTAYYLDGPAAHLGTFGVTVAEAPPAPGPVAYLTDTPDPQAADQFDDLAAAVAWLAGHLESGDTGTVVWQTSTAQDLGGLSVSFDLVFQVADGVDPVIQATGASLVFTAGGALDLTGLRIVSVGGLLLNIDGTLTLADCDLPAETRVVLGGAKLAPGGGGRPGQGTVIDGNRGLDHLTVEVVNATAVPVSLAVTGNQAASLTVTATAALSPDVLLTVAGAPGFATSDCGIDVRLGGTSRLLVRDVAGAAQVRATVFAQGDNTVELRNLDTGLQVLELRGAGATACLVAGCAADSTHVMLAGTAVALTLEDLTSARGVLVEAPQVSGDVTVTATGGAYARGLAIDLPRGGPVTLDQISLTGGQLLVRGGTGGGPSADPGAVTIRDGWFSGAGILLEDCAAPALITGNSLATVLALVGSQAQVSGNLFDGGEVRDDLDRPGLLNDPVVDNEGLLPDRCFTRLDWDGNGCCDYPPAWNATDASGDCTECEGITP